jgi:glycosyltransferase involved in cell wall biosynthesis
LAVEINKQGRLTEHIIYFRKNASVPGRVLAAAKWLQLYKQAIKQYIREHGKPSLVHLHVAIREGILALWIKRKFEIPFVLTEHWTAYLDEARPNFKQLNYFQRYFISKIIKRALKVFPVSDYLGRSIKKRWPSVRYKMIPNVVDTTIFYGAKKDVAGICKFVHVSNLNYQKNPEALFGALEILKEKGINYSLDIFGRFSHYEKAVVTYAKQELNVTFHGEAEQPVLAGFLRDSDALILFSRYETFGCVVIEANACGVPVIVSDMPVMRELVPENENGILVEAGNAQALAIALEEFSKRKDQFDKALITASAMKYSYDVVGKTFLAEYTSVINQRTGRGQIN